MPLFLPSNLSPNFEEVINNIYNDDNATIGVNIDFQFQVNTNGSCVRSYKLEILNDKNDADVEDDNILATFYGIFNTPLYNKDVYTLTLKYDQIQSQMNLVIPKDYRWRIRLYEDNILQQKVISLSKSEIMSADITDIYYDEHWDSELTFKFNRNNLPDKLIYKLNNDNESTWKEYEDVKGDTIVVKLPHTNQWGSIEILSCENDDDGNKIYVDYTGEYAVSYHNNIIDIQTTYGNTYVGAGHTVGTTKNVIWTSKLNNDIVEDKYVQTVLYSHDETNDFNPFNEKLIDTNRQNKIYQKGNILEYKYNDDQSKVLGIKINLNEILPEYREKISDGNMYVCIDYTDPNKMINYDTNQLPKRIAGFSNEDYEGYEPTCILMIDDNQSYDVSKSAIDFDGTYSLVYIQRQQIYSIDKSVGTHQLNKINLDEPLDYNTFHGTNIETGLVSDDFDYGRVYIDPVKEFDSKIVPSAYINIAYTEDQLIDNSASEQYILLSTKPENWDKNYEQYFEEDGDSFKRIHKIYNVLTSENAPAGWNDGEYKNYYICTRKYRSLNECYHSMPEYQNGIFYGYASSGAYVQINSKPSNWETQWSEYYCVTEEKYEQIVDTVAPNYQKNTYYEHKIPEFSVSKYYSYGISKTFLSTYNKSLACIQLTNYVAKTGECSLFSDLKFKPDRFYMYQIFIPDTSAPHYDASKDENPYKLYAGVNYMNVHGDLKFEKSWYLGGQTILFTPLDATTYNINRSDFNQIMASESDLTSKENSVYDYNSDGIVNSDDLTILGKFLSSYPDGTIDQFSSFLRELGVPFSYYESTFIYNNRDRKLPIYSNHQIGNTNQYMCFIQPNSGIYEDKYKPCVLQIYNNKYQHDLYITNYNGNNIYNKNYSIDKLDDSQWLVALTYPNDDFNQKSYELSVLIQKPQTKYKIYTNFVNSIPEAYFYYRNNKILEFEYYDFYNQDNLVDVTEMADKKKIIHKRDVLVKCNIYDSNDTKNKLKNYVPIKYYRYTVADVDPRDPDKINNIIYSSDNLYNTKFQYVLKGLDNYYEVRSETPKGSPRLYRIQITAEDEYGYIHEYAEDVYFGYYQEIVNDRISAEIDCNKQAVHVQFAPVKSFTGEGEVEIKDKDCISIGNSGLVYNSLQDNAKNKIDIPDDFVFYTKLKIRDEMLNVAEEQDIFIIETSNNDTYKATFDTRCFIKNNDGKWVINDNYLSIHFYINNEEQKDYVVKLANIFNFNRYPKQFEYAFSPTSSVDDQSVYVIETSPVEQSVQEINIDATLKYADVYWLPQTEKINEFSIYDNDEYNINSFNVGIIKELYFKITIIGGSVTFKVGHTQESLEV